MQRKLIVLAIVAVAVVATAAVAFASIPDSPGVIHGQGPGVLSL